MMAYEIFESKQEKEEFEKLSPPVNANCIIKKPFTKQDLLKRFNGYYRHRVWCPSWYTVLLPPNGRGGYKYNVPLWAPRG